jgi:hypothetical protein
MAEKPQLSIENRISDALESTKPSQERALRDFRYVVASVNDSALAVWADLWNELRGSVATNGAVTPPMAEGFKPACGWPEFLEKLWLLKHYLDYIHRFCKP